MKTQLSKPARSKASYTDEYKQQALELWRASGRSAAKVAAELGILSEVPPSGMPESQRSASIAASRSGGPDFAAQGTADNFGQALLRAPRLRGQTSVDLSRESKRHGDTALRQFRSGHNAICLIISYTVSRANFLAVSLRFEHGRRRAG
jgi:transposase-like protein